MKSGSLFIRGDKVFIINYIIKANILIKSTNELKEFHKRHTAYINLDDDLVYNNKHLLLNGHIYNLLGEEFQQYLTEMRYDYNDIEVDSYEVVSETDNAEIYFESESDSPEYTLKPNVMAFVSRPRIELLPPSDFNGELVNDNTIKWSWDKDYKNIYGHYILNENNLIVAQIPAGVNYYIESSLEYESNYTRKISRYSAEDTSTVSTPVTVMTSKRSETILRNDRLEFKPRDEFSKEEFPIVDERLQAFHSGIGHGLDLKVKDFKNTDDFFDTYRLVSYFLGVSEYDVPIHTPVDFKYKFIVSGKVPELHRFGHLQVVAESYRYNKIKLLIESFIYKAMPVRWKVKIDGYCFRVDPAYLEEIKKFYDNRGGLK